MPDRESTVKGLKELSDYLYIAGIGDNKKIFDSWHQATEDAIALLREQEPRVMTKEEIIGWDGYIWFEFRGMRAMKVVLIDHRMVREPYRGDYPTQKQNWVTYQEMWRAWTAMPTDEQRKATQWAK